MATVTITIEEYDQFRKIVDDFYRDENKRILMITDAGDIDIISKDNLDKLMSNKINDQKIEIKELKTNNETLKIKTDHLEKELSLIKRMNYWQFKKYKL